MGKVVFEEWVITEPVMGVGKWELKFFRSKLWPVLSSLESDGGTFRWFYH